MLSDLSLFLTPSLLKAKRKQGSCKVGGREAASDLSASRGGWSSADCRFMLRAGCGRDRGSEKQEEERVGGPGVGGWRGGSPLSPVKAGLDEFYTNSHRDPHIIAVSRCTCASHA